MSKFEHKDIVVDKSHETRTKGISKMIDEGGLGADKYYDVVKTPHNEQENSKMVDEGGLGANKNYEEKESIDNFSVSPAEEKKKKGKK